MPGTLYVVATPIGNLEDITLRALRVLREVQLIAAEDTRRTTKLLSHYSIGTRTTSLHEHNEAARCGPLVERLRRGESLALVTDAGTPLISDPGARLVRCAREAGIPVVAVPGPSAITAALSAAGLGGDSFRFLGFPPSRSSARREWLLSHFTPPYPVTVLFEAPHRFRVLLEEMRSVLGDRPILVARELTKLHEELVERPISEHLTVYQEPRGEFTLVIRDERGIGERPKQPDALSLVAEVGHLIENGRLTPREAARQVGARHGLAVNQVYRLLRQKAD